MIDLTTRYLGHELKSPIIVSSSPLCERVDTLVALERAGAGAIALHSLFEEQIKAEQDALDNYLNLGAESYSEALSYLPELPDFEMDESVYLNHVRKAKRALRIPVFASLNAHTPGAWTRIARLLELAGADGIELNTYELAADPNVTSIEIEDRQTALVRSVCEQVSIPVAVKLSPFFTSPANIARRLVEAGASALVLFNRFYQPDFDIEELEVVPNIRLSTSDELRLRLRWTALLHGRVPAHLVITGGVHRPEDVIKCMMAGASAAAMTSALLKNGIDWLSTVIDGIRTWMEEHDYESIEQMRGALSHQAVENPSELARTNYIRTLSSYVAVHR